MTKRDGVQETRPFILQHQHRPTIAPTVRKLAELAS